MRMFLGMGICQSCSAKEILTHVGYRRKCKRCDSRTFADVSSTQKHNYIIHGSVHGERKQGEWRKKFEKNAKEIR